MNKLLHVITNPYKIRYNLYKRFFIKRVDDKKFVEVTYAAAFGKKPDLIAPKTFNEKLQWLKLYDHNPLYTKLVDKCDVKEYVAQTIGEQYIIPTYGVFESVAEIQWGKLPNEFVLKCTHDSGSIVICKDKKTLNRTTAEKKLSSRMNSNPFWDSREWPYKNVKPRIICEKLLRNSCDEELLDYKFMCFNGKPRCVFICSNRFQEGGVYVDFFDMNWEHMPMQRHYANNPSRVFKKPENFELMIQLSSKLSEKIPFVRVDFYEVDGKVYFGELTFYPGSGVEEFTPEEYDELLGSWLQLPNS